METAYPVEGLQKPVPEPAPSQIQQHFAHSTVFVTGATGFLGKLLVEKLLRTCREIEKVYILMRPKKSVDFEKRFEQYFDDVIFGRLKQEYPKALEKVFSMGGDCALPELGLSDTDKKIFCSEVNFIFHVAATVRFDEKIRQAAYINVRGTRDILRLAKRATKLRSFVHVSTAYSWCTQPTIDEVFYKPSVTGEQLLTLVDVFDDDKLDELTPKLLEKWPNTYVFTKSVAEEVVKTEGSTLPIALIRPAIVVATANEPIPGWINNFYGTTGVIAGAGLGIIRTLHCNPNNLANLVPADYVVNAFIAAAWEVSRKRNTIVDKEKPAAGGGDNRADWEEDMEIYNYVTSPQRPLTWQQCMDLGFHYGNNITSRLQVWHHCLQLNSNKYVHLVLHYLMHMLPAYVVDFFAMCIGKRPQLVKGYLKISKFLKVISFFSANQWHFVSTNTQNLWEKLSKEDQALFHFDMSSIDWNKYFEIYIPGIRVFVIKDPMDTVPQGVSKAFRLKIAHYLLMAVLLLVFARLLLFVWKLAA